MIRKWMASTLKIEAESLSKRLVSTYHTPQYYNPEYQKDNLQNREDLKFHMHLPRIPSGKPIYLRSSFISIQLLGRFSRNQRPVRRPVWPWHAAS